MYNLLSFINSFGVTAPLSSLRTYEDYGVGDIQDAYLFLEFLAASNIHVWKMLPVNQTSIKGFDSPYDAESAFAFDMLFIDLSDIEDIDYAVVGGYLDRLKNHPDKDNFVEFERVRKLKTQILKRAFHNFYISHYKKNTKRASALKKFITDEKEWLEDFALYKVLQKEYGEMFIGLWPQHLQSYNQQAIQKAKKYYHKDMLYYMYIQWILFLQWDKLRAKALSLDISLIGDIPAFINEESSDVWSHRNLFHVNEEFETTKNGGAPPDAFAKDGQVWILSVCNWKEQAKDNFSWWRKRVTHMARFFDGLRLDYFMGYVEYWEIEKGEKATDGKWKKGPGMKLLEPVFKEIQDEKLCKFIVEVPTIDPQTIANIEQVRQQLGCDLCVIVSLDFKHLLINNQGADFCVETSTHDMPPLLKKWEGMSYKDKEFLLSGLGIDPYSQPLDQLDDDLRWSMIQNLLCMNFHCIIFPIQDILGTRDQINTPGSVGGSNWAYRLGTYIEDLLDNKNLVDKLTALSTKSHRNQFFSGYGIRSLPWIDGKTKRIYTQEESIHIWALAEKEGEIDIITNLPAKGEGTLRTISMEAVQTSPIGTLYHTILQAQKKGTYFLTVKQNTTYISLFQQDLTIQII